MTMTGDFIPVDDAGELNSEPTYPVAFGIEMTPKVLGIIAAIAGIALAAYLFSKFVQPERQRNQEIRQDIATKQQQLATQEQQLEEIAQIRQDLNSALQQRRNIYSLFANEESMDTLLLDINQRIKNSNASLNSLRNQIRARGIPPILVEAQLSKFTPQGEAVVEDGSLGEGVNGKLKRQSYNLEFSGDFAQTQSILTNIERLEPLLLLKGFRVSSGEPITETVIGPNGQVVGRPKPVLTTTFQVDALIPTGDPEALPEISAPAPAAEGEAAPAAEGEAAPPQ
jgi:type IV pilus assembly protein PilO